MNVAVPYVGTPGPLETRTLCLTRFLGIECEAVRLEACHETLNDPSSLLEHLVPLSCDSIVISPRFIRNWLGESQDSAKLAAYFLRRFRHIIVHGVRPNEWDIALVNSLSEGQLTSIHGIGSQTSCYSVSKERRDICEAFSGLSFGTPDSTNDYVFSPAAQHSGLQPLISIGGQPFMALVKTSHSDVLFIGSSTIADIDMEIDPAMLNGYFSRLIPHAMALRYVAGDACWRPPIPRACIVIDDPLLRTNYGFLNFNSLLLSAQEHRFHAAIAFIPHNFQRSSPRIIAMFRENPDYLSICFHGNDHTKGEFAATNSVLLNTMLRIAEDRMDQHRRETGLNCNRVMVFPQGLYSAQAMQALKSHNFWGAVNTMPLPQNSQIQPRIRDLLQPAVLRTANFPLFLRRHAEHTQEFDIALHCFFGKPLMIVTHHGDYAHPESLCEVADRINTVATDVQWCNLASIVSKTYLVKCESADVHCIHAYSPTISINNDSDSSRTYTVRWSIEEKSSSLSHVLIGTTICYDYLLEGSTLQVSVKVPPHATQTLSVRFQPDQDCPGELGLSWRARAYARRRLSEIRDNHLSKNPAALHALRTFQRRFLDI